MTASSFVDTDMRTAKPVDNGTL